MGKEAGQIGISLPLTKSERKRIIGELNSLNDRVRGQRVDRLVDLVQRSLRVRLNDLFAGAGLSDFAGEPEFAYMPEADVEMLEAEKAFRDLIAAANALAPLLPPTEDSDRAIWHNERPWYPAYDHVTAALSRLRPVGHAEVGATELAAIVNAVFDLKKFGPIADATSSFYNDNPTRWLVRAVMYYRQEQSLPITIRWERTEKKRSEGKFKHRGDRDISPGSATSQLVEATASAFRLNVPVKSFATFMKEYRNAYQARDVKHPLASDITSPLRFCR